MSAVFCFFFQAEDGIRDLVRSRGLGDVYKRQSLGGLSKTTADVVMVLDAVGYDRIIVETVGVGQAEVEVARTAHTLSLIHI